MTDETRPDDTEPCCGPASSDATGGCCGTSRRTFLRRAATVGALAGAAEAAGGLVAPGAPQARTGAAATEPQRGVTPAGEAPAAPPIGLPRTFRGEQLAEIAFPLGGIGTGTIALGGRGELRDWEIWNEPEKGYRPPYAFAAIRAQVEGAEPVARILETRLDPPYRGHTGLDWANAPGMPRLDGCVFHGEYPFARIDFEDAELPVEVSLEAWNPLVPLDAEASGLPLAVLRYRVRNPGARAASVSVAWSLDNPIGPLGATVATAARPREADGRANELRRGERLVGLVMTNAKLPSEHPRKGSFCLAVLGDPAAVTHIAAWRRFRWNVPIREFWQDFVDDGALDAALHQPLASDAQVPLEVARVEVGSLCVERRVEPGAEVEIVYLLGWHLPNRTPEICGWRAPAGEEQALIGNWYATRFADAWAVVAQAAARLPELESETRAFLDAIVATDLPPVVVEAATSNLSVLRTNTCFRTADGRFHGFEGCREKGCCFGSCTHVWNYEAALQFLYPELSRSVRELELGFATDDQGRMDFRYLLPYGRERWGRAAADGQMGVLVKLYLDWRLSGDTEWLRRQWPGAKRALEYAWVPGGWDADRDGVMEGCQHNTYDVEFFGPNPLSGVLYLAALRAGEELARAAGDDASARMYRELFERGSAWIDGNLHNGEYYVQQVRGMALEDIAAGLHTSRAAGDTREPRNQMGEGCLADQVLGQAMAHVAGLGYLLDAGKVRSSLDAVFRYNFKRSLEDHLGLQRIYALNDEAGLILCDWAGKPAPAEPFYYDSEVWTGIEYEVAAHLFHEGRAEQALEIVRAVRARHDGVRRNPWDEAECGSHYVRALASWMSVWLLLGFQYHAPQRRVRIDPRLPEGAPATRGIWVIPTGWGTFRRTLAGGATRWDVGAERGAIDVAALELGAGAPARAVEVDAAGRRVRAALAESAAPGRDGSPAHGSATPRPLVCVELREPVRIDRGQTLRVTLR
jgi:uncharacterized protein (DUF608 family)